MATTKKTKTEKKERVVVPHQAQFPPNYIPPDPTEKTKK